ncbi:MAG: hypothetical protein U9N42_10075 [Campylobacterota bacterium]|nr:hypothetical protein [Campylobacterota bacterium]
MKSQLLKEVAIYFLLLIVSAILMHPDLLSEPQARFELMRANSNYSHPFVYALLVYIIFWIPRAIFLLTKKFFTKK